MDDYRLALATARLALQTALVRAPYAVDPARARLITSPRKGWVRFHFLWEVAQPGGAIDFVVPIEVNKRTLEVHELPFQVHEARSRRRPPRLSAADVDRLARDRMAAEYPGDQTILLIARGERPIIDGCVICYEVRRDTDTGELLAKLDVDVRSGKVYFHTAEDLRRQADRFK